MLNGKRRTIKDEHRTSNAQVSEDSDIECWIGKDEETEAKKPELLDDILEETEELMKIFHYEYQDRW